MHVIFSIDLAAIILFIFIFVLLLFFGVFLLNFFGLISLFGFWENGREEPERRGNGRKWKFWIVCCALFRFPEDEGSEVWRFFVLSCCGL